MSKYFHLLLSIAYTFLVGYSFLLLLELSGLHISTAARLLLMTGWLTLCYTSVYYRAPVLLFFQFNLRRPILAEEATLNRCFADVWQRAGNTRRFRLLIAEESGLNAAAIGRNVIAVTKELITTLEEDQLKAVLAHELGHLLSSDCLLLSAVRTASNLPQITAFLYKRLIANLLTAVRFSRFIAWTCNLLLGATLLLLIVFVLYTQHLLFPVLLFGIFLFLFGQFEKIFRLFHLFISRSAEYRQDAYAHQLGYGPALLEALKEIASREIVSHGHQSVNPFHVLMNHDHPVIYDRIRRLEKLTGLREE